MNQNVWERCVMSSISIVVACLRTSMVCWWQSQSQRSFSLHQEGRVQLDKLLSVLLIPFRGTMIVTSNMRRWSVSTAFRNRIQWHRCVGRLHDFRSLARQQRHFSAVCSTSGKLVAKSDNGAEEHDTPAEESSASTSDGASSGDSSSGKSSSASLHWTRTRRLASGKINIEVLNDWTSTNKANPISAVAIDTKTATSSSDSDDTETTTSPHNNRPCFYGLQIIAHPLK